MANSIVTVAVTQTVAPTPSTLQSSGALISQGATTLAAGESSLLVELADLADILKGALAITSITQVAGLATATATAAHGIPVGDVVEVVIAGATPTAYNGRKTVTATTSTAFTFAINSGTTSPATGTIVYTDGDVEELTSMATTFFAQGSRQAVWVLELGEGDAATGVTALAAYITANPNANYTPGSEGFFYSYLVPRSWANESTYLTFLQGFQAPTSKTYFFTTMDLSNYTDFDALDKCVVGLVEAPATPDAEFSLAAAFYVSLAYRPSPTNKVTPFSFSYLFGVTPYPTKGNSATLAALKAAGVNYVGTGAEGGISNTILLWGTTMDLRGFTYWYSVDALQIYSDINIANAVINGSNNPQNPLYYNQDGIDRLQGVEVGTLNSLISWGLANGQVAQTSYNGDELSAAIAAGEFNGKLFVNAVPFLDYARANPGDYKIGEYDGMTAGYIAQNGFIHILFTVNVSDFVAQ